ncbi:MAG: 2-hydroxychromene-2-carboxylate isomerase [Noviherbaspirillum sp.]
MTTSAHTPGRVAADWYFDFISPFAYLQLEQFDRLPQSLSITLCPVVLGALLTHWQTRGPAEIPEKRRFIYRYAQFRAEQLGIPFKMPPEHPFNPIKALRLAIALGCTKRAVREIFRYIWRDGRSFSSDEDWQNLCRRLEIENADQAIAVPEVKDQLRENTERAVSLGVFGVPSFAVGQDLFWGEDATDLLIRCVESPDWLRSAELRRISDLPVGIQRKV